MKTRRVVGAMTGTSLDGLDVARVEIRGAGLELTAHIEGFTSTPLRNASAKLRALVNQEPTTVGEIAHLARALADQHVAAIRSLLNGDTVDLICAHGQTIYHAPPVSWQIFDAAPIAAAFNAPVVFDLRAADLAAGGQGAPLTPLADFLLLRAADRPRAIVNLGGFCNYTWLPAAAAIGPEHLPQIGGADVCVCNQLLDAVARRFLNLRYDPEGRSAAAGQVDRGLLRELQSLLAVQSHAARSLGTGDELTPWLEVQGGHLLGRDVARTSVEAIAQTLATAIREQAAARGAAWPVEVYLAGGGARNLALRAALAAALGAEPQMTDALGLPMECREAVEFAVLGALCHDGVPISLPQITGLTGPAPRAGAWVFPPQPRE